jgi:V/A-type H+-transporting ATPase subunit B
MTESLVRYTSVLAIVGDILKVAVPETERGESPAVRLKDLAVIEDPSGVSSLAQVIEIDRKEVSLQVFSGTKGLSTDARTRFLGHPVQVTYSENVLGRIFGGKGQPIDGGPDLEGEPKIDQSGRPPATWRTTRSENDLPDSPYH